MGLFDNTNEGTISNFFNMILNADYLEAIEAMNTAINDFFNNGGGIIKFNCPKCGGIIKSNSYDEKAERKVTTSGTVRCKHCDTYIEFKIIDHEDKYRILTKAYDNYTDSDMKDKWVDYLINNVSIDKWKIIFSNVDLHKFENEKYKRIKEILESKGFIFDKEQDEIKGE